MFENTNKEESLTGKDILIILSSVIFLIGVISSVGTVKTGHRGVVVQMGRVTGEVKGEGFYTKLPFIQSIKEIDVRVKKIEATVSAASKDLQSVSSIVAVNYHIDPSFAQKLYQEVGKDFEATLIAPALQESVKASTSKYTAEQLITERESVREDIKNFLIEKVAYRGLIVDSFNVVDFDFSDSFNKAIEDKVTAEQNALASKNKLQQVQFEAEQRIAEAKGKAEAIRVESAALNSNPQVLELRAIEKWDGKLPNVTSGAVPFINVQ